MDTLPSLHAAPASWLRDSVLAPYIGGYCQYLVRRGYADHTVRMYLYCVAHFARWIRRRRIAACDLTDDVVRRFITEHLPRCTCPPPVRRHGRTVRAALRHLLIALDEAGLLRKEQVIAAIDDELRRFDDYMNRARGRARSTRMQRLSILRCFLQQSHGAGSPTQDELRRFIDRQLRRLCPGSAKVVAGTLRAYLRYRATLGDAVAHLLPVITSPANRRLAVLPQTLSQQEVLQLLDAFPQGLPSRHRAYAMVRCLVDLGLRAGEVVTIDLDDIDWEAGTLRIAKNKSRRVDVLPLPQTTGQAIATYLQVERPPTASRRVFVRHVAPVDAPIGPEVLRKIVREAYRRGGLPHTRVHILRHTLASRMLASGSTLKEVADVLRHRELDTSMIYTKVDMVHLSAVAMPWPGGVR
ncbi:tyrosine-type recombinase/integrase [Cupriavidus sp. BIC8F]|uniref:tyrosine-type recombinase/integrase n=1 Tax=Cupriavidus sp. BIC8F TaxID=3079014 RepID=UPI002915CA75|nr:tyrosine-type recombinase/integrase [Cupriavidus sp. BIC8F]